MLSFYVAEKLPAEARYPAVLLVPDNWDDYDYRTRFEVQVHAAANAVHDQIGIVKILARSYRTNDEPLSPSVKKTRQHLPVEFVRLDPTQFCSLGQTSNYYANLRAVSTQFTSAQEFIREFLVALLDVTRPLAGTEVRWWENNDGFATSLLRYNAAHIARQNAVHLLDERDVEAHDVNAIAFAAANLDVHPPALNIEFDGTERGRPGRINVLVGRNGAGKTRLLSETALWLTRPFSSTHKPKEEFTPSFSKVIFISTNTFDSFDLGERSREGSLEFVGIRPGSQTKLQEIRDAAKGAGPGGWARVLPLIPNMAALESLLPITQDNLADDLEALLHINGWSQFVADAFEPPLSSEILSSSRIAVTNMSAGQRALTSLYAGLYRKLDQQSLVLLDEPENFLHPSLIARFIRALHDLLSDRKAFALMATHSPIVVQETPSRFVWIVEREGDLTKLANPAFETFGESIDNLDEYLFETDFRSSHWKQVLRQMIEEGRTNEEIAALFRHELPLLARAYLQRERTRKQQR
jgi:ABC-type cobalamin/Fe3+-siderophores transport system ATPase subunit